MKNPLRLTPPGPPPGAIVTALQLPLQIIITCVPGEEAGSLQITAIPRWLTGPNGESQPCEDAGQVLKLLEIAKGAILNQVRFESPKVALVQTVQ